MAVFPRFDLRFWRILPKNTAFEAAVIALR